MPGQTSEHCEVVVVGAGWSGLICAHTYLKLAPQTNLRVLDASRTIGGVWSKEKVYPDLYAQIGHPLFEYSSYPMPKEGLSPDGFISGNTIHKYLNNFAEDHDLVRRITLETSVKKVERAASGGWSLEVNKGPTVTCDKLIWAVGGTSAPILPKWPTENFSSTIIHSSQAGESQAEVEQIDSAIVVGAAKSAFDTVYMLLRAGKKVDWLIRENGSGPLAMVSPSLFGIWNIIDVAATRIVSAFSPSIFATSGVLYNAINKTSLGRVSTKAVWWTLDKYAAWCAGYSANENFEKLRPEPKGFAVFWAQAGLGAPSAPNFWKMMHEGDLTVHRDEISSLSDKDTVHLKSGSTLHTDMIIACSGYEKPYRPFSEDLRIELGLTYGKDDEIKWAKLEAQGEVDVDDKLPILKEFGPKSMGNAATDDEHLHGPSRHFRRLVPPSMAAENDRTIFFPGMVHSVFTPLIAETQALWGAAYLLGQLELPNEDEMKQEVATFNVWARKRYLAQGEKHAYAIFDFLSYVDVLCRDLGVKTARKSNMFSELFVRYKPSDYNGMQDEYIEANAKRIQSRLAARA